MKCKPLRCPDTASHFQFHLTCSFHQRATPSGRTVSRIARNIQSSVMKPVSPYTVPLLATVLLLAACTSQTETPVEPINADGNGTVQLPGNRRSDSEDKVLTDYQLFQAAQTALKQGDSSQAAQFLAQAQPSAMTDNLRNQWLKQLGQQSQWQEFTRQYGYLKTEARDKETRCYAALAGLENQNVSEEALKELGRQPEGCNRLLEQLAAQGKLPAERAWRRVRGLLSNNQISDARRLAAALGSPLPEPLTAAKPDSQGGREALLYSVTGQNARKQADAAERLRSLSPTLSQAQTGFGWAILGHHYALNQRTAAALEAFRQADQQQLNNTQWEWYARSALRLGRWSELQSIIGNMPEEVRNNPAWQYWMGRSLAAAGNTNQARQHYRQAAASGRNFYALLATEALGDRVDTRNTVSTAPSSSQTAQVAADGAIARALTLFRVSQRNGDWEMRKQAQAEWRYAVNGFNETALLASSKLAHDAGFYEMGIYSADKTNRLLDYSLRYISPFRDVTTRYAAQANVDPAWVYGLIRQESRFMIGARSRVGAAGLMQIMPATAREIAGKIGMDAADLLTIEGNIRMGTWYLGDIRNRLGSEVLATAGYNAGPSRARNWQAATPLEGAVYAETIPFDETRDYVKRVMANATYYASLFHQPQTSLTRRMGTIPAR